mgnify:CR=1 FL=1|jgi:hypothetical protein
MRRLPPLEDAAAGERAARVQGMALLLPLRYVYVHQRTTTRGMMGSILARVDAQSIYSCIRILTTLEYVCVRMLTTRTPS